MDKRLSSAISILLSITSRVANIMVETTKTKAITLKKTVAVGRALTAMPKKPVSVAQALCHPTFSFKKMEAKTTTNSGVVKLKVVAKVKGKAITP